MLQTTHKIPDFKTRLLSLQQTEGKTIPGFQKVREDNSPRNTDSYTDSLQLKSKSSNSRVDKSKQRDWIKAYSVPEEDYSQFKPQADAMKPKEALRKSKVTFEQKGLHDVVTENVEHGQDESCESQTDAVSKEQI